MALSARQQALIWTLAAAVFLVLLWLLGDVILPFLIGAGVAYILDPVADRLQRLGLSRGLAVALITCIALVAILVAVPLLVSTLASQARQLGETALPQLFDTVRDWIETNYPQVGDADWIREQLGRIGEAVQARAGEIINGVLSSAAGVMNIVLLFVIVPVVSVYLLLDWDNMVARIDDLLPRDHRPTLRRLGREIDATLASFIRGQGLVCLILGTYYAVALGIIGLNFGIFIGALAGLVTFIPYLGAVIGFTLSIGLALFQFWGEWWYILGVYAVFQSGQFVEGNILTPKLVGSSVGLHPVWLLLALAVFGALFGFVGLLVAVPVSAALGVLARFGVERYKESQLYRGSSGTPARGTVDPSMTGGSGTNIDLDARAGGEWPGS